MPIISETSIIFVGGCFVAAVLLTLYLIYLRLNAREAEAAVTLEAASLKELVEHAEEPKTRKESPEMGKKDKKKEKKNNNKAVETKSLATTVKEQQETIVSPSLDEEEDLLLLARLQGRNSFINSSNSSVRQRTFAPVSEVASSSTSSVKGQRPREMSTDFNGSAVGSTPTASPTLTPEELEFIMHDMEASKQAEVRPEAPSVVEPKNPENNRKKSVVEPVIEKQEEAMAPKPMVIISPTRSAPSSDSDWSQVLSKEEEQVKVLKNKVNTLQAELLAANDAAAQAVRVVDREQNRLRRLEQELKDQRAAAAKRETVLEAQMNALRNVNSEMAVKLAANAEDKASSIEMEQLQAALKKSNDRVSALEAQRSEEASQLEQLKHELQHELQQHQAEHKNAVGAGIALHQEISQLKLELQTAQTSTKVAEARELRALEALQMMDGSLNEQKASNEQLHMELQQAKEKVRDNAVMASFAPPPGMEEQMEDVRGQLAAAEATIASLQADLQREIKRAEIAKRVYETKLAELGGN